VSGYGFIGFTASASGIEEPTGAAVTGSSSGGFIAWKRALEAGLTASPTLVEPGQAVLFLMTVTNTGGSAANNVRAQIWQSAGSGRGTATGPYPVVVGVVNPGETVAYSWTVTAVLEGPMVWSGTAEGDGFVTSLLASSPEITVRYRDWYATGKGMSEGGYRAIGGRDGTVSPKGGEQAKLQVWPGSGGEVALKVYDAGGGLVRELRQGVSGGRPTIILWDCRDSSGGLVAPGVYRVYVTGPGVTQKDPVVVLVKR